MFQPFSWRKNKISEPTRTINQINNSSTNPNVENKSNKIREIEFIQPIPLKFIEISTIEYDNLKEENEILKKEKNELKLKIIKNINIQLKDAQETIICLEKEKSNLEIDKTSALKKINELKGIIDVHKTTVQDLNSSLNEKENKIKQLEENLLMEMKRVAEKIRNSSSVEKFNKTQLNGELPMASDISNDFEQFINTIEEYYMNSNELENCDGIKLVNILRRIIKVSYEHCITKFKQIVDNQVNGVPTSNQLYDIRCMVHSSIDKCINETAQTTFEQLGPLFAQIHRTDEMENAERFIVDCCKFIWTVFLSQPEVRFNDIEFEEPKYSVLYSKAIHKSFNQVDCEMNVKLTIIPSIYLVRDNSLLSKSYVFLEPIEKIKNQDNSIPSERLSNSSISDTTIHISDLVDGNKCDANTFKEEQFTNSHVSSITLYGNTYPQL